MSSPALIGLTLYKHGVGYFQRSGPVQNPLTLLFDRGAMNDVLKSLTVSI